MDGYTTLKSRYDIASPEYTGLLNQVDLVQNQSLFQVGIDNPGVPHPLPNDKFARWAIGPRNLYLNFSDPTVLNLENKKWKDDYVVIPKEFPEGSWIYLIIYGNSSAPTPGLRRIIPAAHPV